MKRKSKYLLNVEGKKKYRGESWVQLIFNVLKGNYEKGRTSAPRKR